MEKSLDFTSKFVLQKSNKRKTDSSADWLSQLSDDILIIILSLLTMKEAARTSILSHRWKNLWTFTTGTLDFDKRMMLSEITNIQDSELQEESLGIERSKYVSWVNQILNSHKGVTLDAFKLCFDLDSKFRSDIDEWINFAIQKRVQCLEVDLQRVHINWIDCHPFPMHLFLEDSNVRFLTVLNLSYVRVNRQFLKNLLCNCPLLEILRLSNAPYLSSLKVCGASLKLKCLEIIDCCNLKSLEISNMNLTSLKYYGQETKLRLKNVPNLATLSFGGPYPRYTLADNYKLITTPLREIETLTLDSSLGDFTDFNYCNKFRKLKQLKLTVSTDDYQSLPSCDRLLNACPVLYRLAVEFKRRSRYRSITERRKKKHKLKSLKVLELHGFQGCLAHFEFAAYLFEKSVFLEKLTVDTRKKIYKSGTLPDYVEDDWTLYAKEVASNYASRLSPQAQLLIL